MNPIESPERRDFLTKTFAVGVGAILARAGLAMPEDTRPAEGLPRRPFGLAAGKTGRELSIIGLGGIVVSALEQAEANNIVARAVDRGLNYFDVAPTYGNAQERLGPALQPYREGAFLACKTTKRTAAEAQAELEQSLRLLRTDHLDLYQLHGLSSEEETKTALGAGGALETFVKAKEKGLVRHLGFSAHSVSAAFMALEAFAFESVLFPFNVVCLHRGGFGRQVLAKAKQKGAARLALKALAWTKWPPGAPHAQPKCWYQPITDRDLAYQALRYTLDLPITAALPPGDPKLFEMAVDLGLRYQPLKAEERGKLIEAVKDVEAIFG